MMRCLRPQRGSGEWDGEGDRSSLCSTSSNKNLGWRGNQGCEDHDSKGRTGRRSQAEV